MNVFCKINYILHFSANKYLCQNVIYIAIKINIFLSFISTVCYSYRINYIESINYSYIDEILTLSQTLNQMVNEMYCHTSK